MSSSSTPTSDMPAGAVSATLDTTCTWPPHHSLRTAVVLLIIASGIKSIMLVVLPSWGVRPGTHVVVASGLEALLAMGLLVFGRKAAILTLSFLSASALWPFIRNVSIQVAKGMEIPVGVSALLHGPPLLPVSLYLLTFVLLLIGKQRRARYAIALTSFTFYELISIVSVVVLAFLRQRGLPH